MRRLVLTQGTGGLMGEACKRLELLGALAPRHDGLGGHFLCCRASAGPGSVQHDTQPQESQECQLVEKQVWNHDTTSSLGGETGEALIGFQGRNWPTFAQQLVFTGFPRGS